MKCNQSVVHQNIKPKSNGDEMKKKLRILAIATSFTFGGAIIGNIHLKVLAQSSPWGQVESPQTYTNPDTGQTLCFYSSSRWAPCPGQGNTIIISPNANCRGGTSMTDLMNQCPAAQCLMDQVQSRLNDSPALPCTGLP